MSEPVDAGIACRLCATRLPPPFLDLGDQPLPDHLIDPTSAEAREADQRYPTALTGCRTCGLIQLATTPPRDVDIGHGHGTRESASLSSEDRRWAEDLFAWIPTGERWRVMILGDAWALAPAFAEAGHSVVSVPRGDGVDLVIANHVLAHADDLTGALSDIARSVRPGGLVAIETHHALGLAYGQSDIVSPVHRSYLTLAGLGPAIRARGLDPVATSTIDRYGGALRMLARRRPTGSVDSGIPAEGEHKMLAAERLAGLDDPTTLAAIGTRAEVARSELRAFLAETRARGRRVVGYGAASRGIALLNAVGVTVDDLPLIVDRAPAKQGRLTPGGRIPIEDPGVLPEIRPDYLLVLPWPLLPEIAREQSVIGAWGGKLVVALPSLKVVAADDGIEAAR